MGIQEKEQENLDRDLTELAGTTTPDHCTLYLPGRQGRSLEEQDEAKRSVILRRDKLVPALKRAKAKGKRASIVGSKLVIEGNSYMYMHWQIPQRWLHDDPEDDIGVTEDCQNGHEGTYPNPPEADSASCGEPRPTATV
ncbi:hypothetical protein Bbelb_221260 [Branchiostoma belcheri]|nr:hypothetical protein Bbelb_221260 [Branchiostoma belcheri]